MMGSEARDDDANDAWDESSGVDTDEGSSLLERDESVSWLDEQFVDSW
jgi:hypothetical protein